MSDSEAGSVDFMYLLDRLEETLVTGSRVPLMARTLVDEQECLDILDQLRVAMPTEIKEARRIIAERDHILAQAREETERIIRGAEHRASRLVEEHTVVRNAQSRAMQIEEQAERDSQQVREEAEQYAETVLSRVQERLDQALSNVRAGLRELEVGDRSPR
jgi:cell division septum initiation protein DivIVA